ncbi:MAG: SUMF1/EgtB/PvdO family nonheme iron enzyme [Alphaproteobacteria bacterium]|nr:SUMF1/EgtB/PvdO family nonheme iron enzyme [Alphaproteobacteria bacterium]
MTPRWRSILVRLAGWLLTVGGVVLVPWSLWPEFGEEGPMVGPLRPEMMVLPAGTFDMGPSDDTHEVTLSRFAIARTEVTQGMYERVMGENPSESEYKGVSLLGETLPVQNVSWLDAVRYCNALSALEGLTPAYRVEDDEVTWDRDADGYRLPTEEEWEYAARGGTSHTWAGTSEEADLCSYANVADAQAKDAFGFSSTSCDDGVAGLAPVGHYRANAWNLYDMSGNVWEWVWDWVQEYPEGLQDNPEGPSAGSLRVARGGSWNFLPVVARVAGRYRWSPSYRDNVLGFRPARSFPSAL